MVVPVFNEEPFITSCLMSLIEQDYPRGRYEILVCDGGSSDRTRELVLALGQRTGPPGPDIRVLHNGKRIQAAAMNRGIAHARGEIIVRMDGHALAPPFYLRACVEPMMMDESLDAVGGLMVPEGHSYWGRAIAAATTSRFGVGNSRHRTSLSDTTDELGWLGAYRKSTLETLGGYDETVPCNEDDDLGYRMRRASCRFVMTPRIPIRYFCRSSLRRLAVQYFRYGYFKVAVLRKNRAMRVRHIVPPVFVLALMAAVAAAVAGVPWLLVGLLASYAAAGLVASVSRAGRTSWSLMPALPLVFAVLHVGYGAGFWAALVTRASGLRARASMPMPPRAQ